MNIDKPSHIDLLLKRNLIGGNPVDILNKISNETHQYLEEKSSNSSKLKFQFDNELNLQQHIYNKYLGKGANTLVCAIKQIKPIMDDKIYIIRITEEYGYVEHEHTDNETLTFALTNFIQNHYIEDKLNFKYAIPNIYCYGKILDENGRSILTDNGIICYVITEYYHTDFNKLLFDGKLKIFINLLKLKMIYIML